MTERETQVLDMIRAALLRAKPLLGGRQVVLFGARAGHRAKPRSDFDLGVLGPPLPPRDFSAIEDMLENLPTLYRIDWVDLSRAEPRFVERTLREHRVIHG
jgi:predicted nucleotidyltransferase